MQRIIEITISRNGAATLQTKGFSGADCLQASRFLEQALGVSLNESKSAEFYQTTPMQQSLQQ